MGKKSRKEWRSFDFSEHSDDPMISVQGDPSNQQTAKNVLQKGQRIVATKQSSTVPEINSRNEPAVNKMEPGISHNEKLQEDSMGMTELVKSFPSDSQLIGDSDIVETSASPAPHFEPHIKLDVYAKPFVPQALTAINEIPSATITTAAGIDIKYEKYISSFSGDCFLCMLHEPSWPCFESLSARSSENVLEPETYCKHYTTCLDLDLQAENEERKTHNLYAAHFQRLHPVAEMYSLHVPGIREGTPSVSFGDFVMLRRLVLRFYGTGSGLNNIDYDFTGYQIRAVVMGIDKPKDLIVLNAAGIGSLGGIDQVVCNVIFRVQPRVVRGLRQAVADIGRELSRIGFLTNGTPSPVAHDGQQPVVSNEALHVIKDASCAWLKGILFPTESNGEWQIELPSMVFSQAWFDQDLNYEQMRAVDAVQSRTYGNLCYLVNGPPGTGKTKTICEAVAQLTNDAGLLGSILLCAPSDQAADTLAMRLRLHFGSSKLLRLNEISRTFSEVPQELLPFCYVQDDSFNLPPFSKIMAYKIIIVTCTGADMLVQARLTNRDLLLLQREVVKAIHPDSQDYRRFSRLHWAALFIDEAAQATEPETLIPLSVVAPPQNVFLEANPIFVMAGDQHQLNARTYDKSTSLHVSLFERLSNAEVYAAHPLARENNSRVRQRVRMLRPPFVNLVRNYRSHPAILAVPSSLFYSNTLIPEASNARSLHSWTRWQGRRWPVLFACNAGQERCEDITSSGSGWFNTSEVRKAIIYAHSLLDEKLILDPRQICIMSPFRAQVQLLRQTARNNGLGQLNIGPMEAFQGLESRFVIICTTRANSRFLAPDSDKGIGIVGEKKKFNVAITRAKEGLVVIGNPWVLARDPCWLGFLHFCQRNGLWQDDTGSGPSPVENAVNSWRASSSPDDGEVTGFERALLFEGRDKTSGSAAAKRFMKGSESVDEAMWREGVEAEEILDAAGFESGEET